MACGFRQLENMRLSMVRVAARIGISAFLGVLINKRIQGNGMRGNKRPG